MRCNDRELYLGNCDYGYGTKTKRTQTGDAHKNDKKQPFLIIAADEEDESSNDLTDAESSHGYSSQGHGPYSFGDNVSFNENAVRQTISLNNDIYVNNGRRRGKSRKPFVIQVPDDNENEHDENDLREEQTRYFHDPFLIEVSLTFVLSSFFTFKKFFFSVRIFFRYFNKSFKYLTQWGTHRR